MLTRVTSVRLKYGTHTHIIIAKSRGDMSLVTLWRASTKYANKGEAGMVRRSMLTRVKVYMVRRSLLTRVKVW